ncbi:hypothetical protein FAM09_15340 [Niastella caeni]|uniref:Uncharacterized protein n=1 Tax=Niastella caeni TaxID=2569763 RepID=A0A4S8HRC7_9BACT|nr:hypothetical protein [Niastella caeni]THU38057.1 hypothetical protein FAM09_15340 [Niastella caeni]
MKCNSFVRFCAAALLLCVLQVNAMYANNGGTQAAAPAPKKSGWNVSLQSLKKFDEVQTIMAKLQSQSKVKGSTAVTNSSLTNYRPNGDVVDMAWLEVTFTDGTPTAYLNAFGSKIVVSYGQTDAFTLPDLHNVASITLRHFGSYFWGNEYATIQASSGGPTYMNDSPQGDRLDWSINASLTGGLTIIIY